MLKQISLDMQNGKMISEKDLEFFSKYVSKDGIVTLFDGNDNDKFKLTTKKQFKQIFSDAKDTDQEKEKIYKTINSTENKQQNITSKNLSSKKSQIKLLKSIDNTMKEVENKQKENKKIISK